MILLELPKRPLNDNEPRTGWHCRACQYAYFLLIADSDGATTIHCGSCDADMTAIFLPLLKGEQCPK